jgi:hypothetical protein
VHELASGELVLSLDLEKHMQSLPTQRDVLELLEMPLPLPPAASLQADKNDNNLDYLAGLMVERPTTPNLHASARPVPCARHTLLTDALIFKYVDVYGPRWGALAHSLGGRDLGYSVDVVRDRYFRIVGQLYP